MRIGFMMGYNRERMEFAKTHGFKSLELQVNPDLDFFPGHPDWQQEALEMKGAFDETNLRISCLAGFYVNHMEPRKAEEYAALTRGVIELASHIGVGAVAGFAGRIVDAPLEDSLLKFKEIWSEHARFADDRGVKIGFENCPMGPYHQPPGGINCMCTPHMWEAGFDAVGSDALGLEWDPSHLLCMFIDPVANLRKFGSRVVHVHAKDAKVHQDLLAQYGVWHRGVIEHCFPGLGDTDWAACIKELRRQGYEGDLNIEGWHDEVFRDHKDGLMLEDEGLIIGLRHLEQFVVQS